MAGESDVHRAVKVMSPYGDTGVVDGLVMAEELDDHPLNVHPDTDGFEVGYVMSNPSV